MSLVELWLTCRRVWLVSKRFLFSHRQSRRRFEELSLRPLDFCPALGQEEAMHSLLKRRSPYGLAFSSTVVAVDISLEI